MFKYLFTAKFIDGHIITQPADDRSINHVEGADHNPSAYTDVQDYIKSTSPVGIFSLQSEQGEIYAVNLSNGEFFINGSLIMLDQPLEELTDRKLIYHRTGRMDTAGGEPYIYAYNFGYEGKNAKGKTVKKVITIR